MKILNLLITIAGLSFVSVANAADITIFYSPTCPHCHHARDFISNNLIYEYADIKVSEVNVMNIDNRQAFVDALYKCGYKTGGVPVLVVGDMNEKEGFKCFQGYSDASQPDLRAAVEMDLTDEQKTAAATNKAEMEKDRDAFVAAHADRKDAISDKDSQKKNNE